MAKWSIPLEKIAERVQIDMHTAARKIMLDIFNNVLNRSPVRSGRFRANWNASLGIPDRSTTDSTNQGRGYEQAKKAAALDLGAQVYFTNSLPYAVRLENGWSDQAPVGMVKVSVVEARRIIREALKK